MRFREVVEEVLREYNEEYLDEIAPKVKEFVEEEMKALIIKLTDEEFKRKLGLPSDVNDAVLEDFFYSHRELYERCFKEAEKKVKKNVS